MVSSDLRAYYRAERMAAGVWNREIQMFLTLAMEVRFEMRYMGEDRWYPVPTIDVAETLGAYHPDLHECFERLLEGEEVPSRLALFRVSPRSLRALKK
jgi:hypothetical protein